MTTRKRVRATLVCMFLFLCPSLGFPQLPEVGRREFSNLLAGGVFLKEGNVPVQGAILRAFNPHSGQVFSTVTASQSGSFILPGLPNGSYELSVETPEGVFYVEESVTVSGGTRSFLSFSIAPEPLPKHIQERLARRKLDPATARGVGHAVVKTKAEQGGIRGGRAAAIVLGALGGAGVLGEVLADQESSPLAP